MRLLKEEECVAWCASRGIQTASISKIWFEQGQDLRIKLILPKEFLRCVALTLAITNIFKDTLPSSLFWIRQWEIWGEKFEELGTNEWQKLRMQNNPDQLDAYRGHIFSEGDRKSLIDWLLLPILWQWDAQWVSDDGASFVDISHDGILEIVARDHHAKKIINDINDWRIFKELNATQL